MANDRKNTKDDVPATGVYVCRTLGCGVKWEFDGKVAKKIGDEKCWTSEITLQEFIGMLNDGTMERFIDPEEGK